MPKLKNRGKSTGFWHEVSLRFPSFPLFAIAFLLIGGFSIKSDRFLTSSSISQLLISASIIAIVGVGEAFVLISKNIDVSVGSIVGFSAYFTASIAAKNQSLPLPIVVLIGVCIGMILGTVNGIIVANLEIPSIMVTLGTLYVFRGIDSMIVGSNEVTAQFLSKSFSRISSWTFLGLPGMFFYAAFVCICGWAFLQHTYSGRSIAALGSNITAAKKIGINSKKLVFLVYLISGGLSGFAGVLWASRYGTVNSTTGFGFELVVLAAVVVGGVSVNGGTGSIAGVFFGSLILGTISVGLALVNVSQFWVQAIQGAAIITAISLEVVFRKRKNSGRRSDATSN